MSIDRDEFLAGLRREEEARARIREAAAALAAATERQRLADLADLAAAQEAARKAAGGS